MAKPFSVCVFCGSRVGNDAAYLDDARALGLAMGTEGWRLVYGGGNVGLMGAVADAVNEGGGSVTGIIPQSLLDREVGKRDVDQLIVTKTMFERKERMIAASDAFVTIAGGFGTLDELLEVITLKQLDYHNRPILILDTAGIWTDLLRSFDSLIERGFADAGSAALWQVVSSVEEALLQLRLGAANRA